MIALDVWNSLRDLFVIVVGIVAGILLAAVARRLLARIAKWPTWSVLAVKGSFLAATLVALLAALSAALRFAWSTGEPLAIASARALSIPAMLVAFLLALWARRLDNFMGWLGRNAAAIAIIVGGPWAVYQFWYKDVFLPSQKPVFAVVNTSIDCQSGNDALAAVTCRIDVGNPGSREANVFAAYYIVEAERVVPTSLRDPEYRDVTRKALTDTLDIAHRYVNPRRRQPICSGRILNALGTLVPGQNAVADIVTFVPRDTFDLVRIYAIVVTQPRYSSIAPMWEIVGGGFVRFKLAKLVAWTGPGTGQYESFDPSDVEFARLGLNTTIARAETLIPSRRPGPEDN